ncbi:MAG: prolyl 4-hydroxylase [Burkholderiaceae bacterium]|nr:MAG: prolyl 4-hydroxylase [Burkholderiaceae bacterium]
MTPFDAKLDRLDWTDINAQLDTEGHAVLPALLDMDTAQDLAQQIATPGMRRVRLESNGLGRGELFYLEAGMAAALALWRIALYRRLVPIANRWNEILGIQHCYPAELEVFLQHNRRAGQTRAQSHLSRLGVEDYITLHQCNDGEEVFPMQVVAVLSAPGTDFEGGEFVTTERRPRLQSCPSVLPLALGDMAIIATAARPFQGTRGAYRVNLKHAISHVRQGERIGLELSFHDAP